MGLDKARGTIERPSHFAEQSSRLETIGDADRLPGGYYLMVCLPTSETEWTAHPNTLPNDELAEANFERTPGRPSPLNQRRLSTLSTLEEISTFENQDFQIVGLEKRLTARARQWSSRGQPGETKPRSKPAGYDTTSTSGNKPESP